MPWGIAAAGLISGGLGLFGASRQSSAVSNASAGSIAAQQAMFDATREDLNPFKWAGQDAARVIGDLSGAHGAGAANAAMSEFTASPGYQFRLNEGLRAVQNSAAAVGALGSGNTLRALVDYGQGQASQEFSNYYNRLFGLAQLGSNAAAQTGQAGITTGQGIASTMTSAGAAQAGIIGNATSGLTTQLNNTLGNVRWNTLYGGQDGGPKSGFGGSPSYGAIY